MHIFSYVVYCIRRLIAIEYYAQGTLQSAAWIFRKHIFTKEFDIEVKKKTVILTGDTIYYYRTLYHVRVVALKHTCAYYTRIMFIIICIHYTFSIYHVNVSGKHYRERLKSK